VVVVAVVVVVVVVVVMVVVIVVLVVLVLVGVVLVVQQAKACANLSAAASTPQRGKQPLRKADPNKEGVSDTQVKVAFLGS
jgi:Tfp pilus assembly protein PilX